MTPTWAELAISVVIMLLSIGSFVLLIVGIIDAIKNPHLTENERIIWVIVICLVAFFGPILYFLVGKRTPRR